MAVTLKDKHGNTILPGTSPELTQMVAVATDGSPITSAKGLRTYEGVLFPSAARTTAQTSPNQTNENAVGLIIYVTVSAITGGPGLGIQPQLCYTDPASGLPVVIAQLPKITAASTTPYMFGTRPGATAANFGTQALQRTWFVQVLVSDATSYTYSVGFDTTF